MRIAIVMRSESAAGGGGAERRFARLFEYLRARGCDIHLILNSRLFKDLLDANLLVRSDRNSSMPSFAAVTADKGLNFICNVHVCTDRGGSSFVSSLAYNLYVMRSIQTLKPDIVHLPLLQKSLLPLYLWLYLHPAIKLVNTVALSWFGHSTKIPLSLLLLAKLVWRRANAIDSLYPGLASGHGKGHQRKISITPCSFTDTEKFAPSYPKAKEIVFAGRLIPEKNPLLLVQALANLNSEDSGLLVGWRVYILGQGPMEQRIKTEVSRAGLDNIISIYSAPCISTVLRHSRIFVSLQETENYPSQSLLEAMASGNAIIATDVGETRRWIDERTGLLIHKGDYRGLAKALRELISEEAKCYQLGLAARRHVLAHCSLSRFADYMGSVWENARNA